MRRGGVIAALCNHEVVDLFRHCVIGITAPAARIDRYRLRHCIAHESAAPLGPRAPSAPAAITPATPINWPRNSPGQYDVHAVAGLQWYREGLTLSVADPR